jgi:hypothetical protein
MFHQFHDHDLSLNGQLWSVWSRFRFGNRKSERHLGSGSGDESPRDDLDSSKNSGGRVSSYANFTWMMCEVEGSQWRLQTDQKACSRTTCPATDHFSQSPGSNVLHLSPVFGSTLLHHLLFVSGRTRSMLDSWRRRCMVSMCGSRRVGQTRMDMSFARRDLSVGAD